MAEYAHPEVLVSTQWVAEHLSDPKIRLVEVDVDTAGYDQGHIAGAVGWNWQTQLQDNVRRGAELVGGQGGVAPQFMFAQLFRARKWDCTQAQQYFGGGRFLPFSTISPRAVIVDRRQQV